MVMMLKFYFVFCQPIKCKLFSICHTRSIICQQSRRMFFRMLFIIIFSAFRHCFLLFGGPFSTRFSFIIRMTFKLFRHMFKTSISFFS